MSLLSCLQELPCPALPCLALLYLALPFVLPFCLVLSRLALPYLGGIALGMDYYQVSHHNHFTSKS